jgi:hypothetical protein
MAGDGGGQVQDQQTKNGSSSGGKSPAELTMIVCRLQTAITKALEGIRDGRHFALVAARAELTRALQESAGVGLVLEDDLPWGNP